MSSRCICRLPGLEEVRHDVFDRPQAVQDDLPANDEERDAQSVLDGEFDESGHGRSHVGPPGC